MAETARQPVPAPLRSDQASAVLHSVMLQLDASQWWTPEQLELGMQQQLQQLLLHAQTHSPFYRQRLRDIDVANFTRAAFADIPLLTRADLQQSNQTIDAEYLPANHGSPQETMTSGSTGTPVRIRGTGVTALMWNALNLREHLWHQRDTRQVACSIRWRSDGIGLSQSGVTLPDWGVPINQFFHTAPSFYLNSAVDIAQQRQWLLQRQPVYLLSHPSNVAALARSFRKAGESLPALREIRTLSESVGRELRELVQEVFGTSITDCYSSQELGYIALQCPQFAHYHVQSESVLVEVLRADGSQCAPFEPGRLVITSLRNYATPLIRYELGDYGALGDKCPCGRGLPVLYVVKGRVRNMLQLPDGTQHWPNFGFRKMMEIVDLRQFQIVQTQLDRVEFKLVVDAAPLTVEQETQLKQVLQESLGYPLQIAISYHEALPHSGSGKFEDFVSLISAD